MINSILQSYFMLIQLSIFSVTFAIAISSKKRYKTVYNNSIMYKMTITFLLFGTFILSLLNLKWWLSILYFIASFYIESMIASFIILFIIPNSFFHPTELYLRRPISHRLSLLFILLNYMMINIFLLLS